MNLLRQPPLALYVHFPWCVQKCPYCDFNSYTLHGELPTDTYIDALIADLDAQTRAVAGRPLVSAFFGGGTPSLFSPAAIARLIEAIGARFALAPDLELTLEANPGTIERGRFAEYRAAGVSRVSLGAQSFAAAKLTALGRIHGPDDTRRAAEELHAAGLDNFNLDLMYGLPEQSVAEALADIDAALALQPQHISHYQLTLEPGTVFAAAPPVVPSEESIDAMLAACQPRLAAARFERYEVSAYATPGRECAHNLNYWQFGDYLGVGAGAHGKLTDTEHGVIRRTQQPRDPRRYLRAGPAGLVSNEVAVVQLPFEFMLNALRCVDGFEAALFTARTGLPFAAIEPTLEKLRSRGLLARDPSTSRGANWRATEHGFRFLNEVLLDFLPSGDSMAASANVPDRPAAARLSTAVGALRRE
ncbi:MAG TPA: radical SAM family heme chaperone HemW [Steroidobacteraceae bacterium]|nr:radical SAM family heme chaperone HemW [Steroidobacteraceae bacterium]HRX89857.1 radical SAM family heme chaperone HemW [Steroidobacteraceae bacterium]